MANQEFKTKIRRVLDPITALFDNVGISPMLVSLFGLALSLYGAVIVGQGALFTGGVFLLLASLCDVIDGDLARRRNSASRFGAFIDSTFDRVTEFAYFGGIIFYLVNRPDGFRNYELIVVLVALAGSVLTSYARARAEGIGCECKVGILERPERMTLFIAGLIFGYRVLQPVMFIIAAASMFTFIQRILHVHRVASDDAPSTSPGADSTPD